MCGIAGAVSTRPIAEGVIEAATQALAHRGPDDSGLERFRFASGQAVFGNRRLAILDLSAAGHMPMQDSATGDWITYNGEIYNFRELREELKKEGIVFTSDSDTEVILKGYARFGGSWFGRLRGMFGIAIFDAGREELVLARDRFGIKPLYFAVRDGALYFSSEVRGLLKAGIVPRELDPVGLYQFLSFGSVSDPQTIIKGVEALPAGHVLRYRSGMVQVEAFHTLREAFANRDSNDLPTARARVAELVRDSVRKHIVSDVPVSLFLSGGIDSSVLALALRQMQVPDIHSFSVVFNEADHSEADDARFVAQQAGTTHCEVPVSADDVLRDIPAMLRAMDQPSYDGINSFVVARAVRRAGFKVALSGLGGDELFAGYSTFAAMPVLQRWQSRLRGLPNWMRHPLSEAVARARTGDQAAKMRALLSPPFPHPYQVLRCVFTPETVARLMRNTDADVEGMANRPLQASINEAAGLDANNRGSYLELVNYMRNTLLRDADAMSMANSLEVRVPFVDHELLDYVASLPGDWKSDGHRPKTLLAAAFADVLPDRIVHKTKQGFTLPFSHWLRRDLKSTVEESLTTIDKGSLAEFISAGACREVWGDFLAGKTSWTRPWSLFVLRQWCQYNLD